MRASEPMEQSCKCLWDAMWEVGTKADSLQEQQVLSATEPLLQTRTPNFKTYSELLSFIKTLWNDIQFSIMTECQNVPKSISAVLYYVKRRSECWQSTLKNEDDLHAVGTNTQSGFNSSYKQVHPMSLVCTFAFVFI